MHRLTDRKRIKVLSLTPQLFLEATEKRQAGIATGSEAVVGAILRHCVGIDAQYVTGHMLRQKFVV